MATNASNDDSESVDQFLARIASLKDRRDREDEERTRKLEEEILQGRRERQARRAERARSSRSVSPTKSSPAPSISAAPELTSNHREVDQQADPEPIPKSIYRPSGGPVMSEHSPSKSSPRPQLSTPVKSVNLLSRTQVGFAAPAASTMSRRLPTPPAVSQPFTPPQTNLTSLSRSGTLSWQQRPSSRDSDSSRPRPLSGVHATNLQDTSAASLKSKSTDDLSRTDIARALGSKDPSWFRQTNERGLGSAAYRKTQVEEESERDRFASARSMKLHGMACETAVEPERPNTPRQPASSGHASRKASPRDEPAEPSLPARDAFSTSPFPHASSQVLEPSSKRPPEPRAKPEGGALDAIPTQPGMTSSRPASPTKGLGGFVQSAMMKRSDSMSKRWSVQASTGLKRGDSVASNRSTLAAAGTGGISNPPARSPTRGARALRGDIPSSPLGSSRPASSHAETPPAIGLDHVPHKAEPVVAKYLQSNELPEVSQQSAADEGVPVSPSRTMDARRWSPTKASWLESALTRPDSPKVVPAKNEQPAWKVEVQRSRGAKEEVPSSSFEVQTKGLLRSPPTGIQNTQVRPFSLAGTSEFNASPTRKPATASPGKSQDVESEIRENAMQSSTALADTERYRSPKPSRSLHPVSPAETVVALTEQSGTSSAVRRSDESSKREAPQPRPKPQTPPKIDFRANLKPRQTGPADAGNAEPEFKAMFGKLKRAQTKNYVAPDELKNNITQGKAALSVTGGPQKTMRIDEFKESILKKKDAIRASSGSSRKPSTSVGPPVPEKSQMPEALAKRQLLNTLTGSATRSSEAAETVSVIGRSTPQAEESRGAVFTQHPLAVSSVLKPSDTEEKSKLAARLNPALAGMISKTGNPKVSEIPKSQLMQVSKFSERNNNDNPVSPSESGNLTHMTKARAKGPKRRLPKADAPVPRDSPAEHKVVVKAPSRAQLTPFRIDEDLTSEPSSTSLVRIKPDSAAQPRRPLHSQLEKPVDSASISRQIVARIEPAVAEVKEKPRPAVAAKSPELRKVSSPPNFGTSITAVSQPVLALRNVEVLTGSPGSTLPSGQVEPKVVSILRPEKSNTMPLTPSTTKMNSPRVVRARDDESQSKASARPPSKSKGLGLDLDPSKRINLTSELTPPPEPANGTVKSSKAINDFFGHVPKARDKAEFDTQSIMSPSLEARDKIKTLNMQIWEVHGDGKKHGMPPQQEHILFEEAMYLCSHVFQNTAGVNSTEVYLWCGDGVGEAAIEDAQLFCRKAARESNAKLEVVRQGKESSRFFQALGGIVITRRNKASALYMLCGRRHLGHVAFDEVDLDLANLCSGFPFIVSAKFGKLYLWKGNGSGADELGCARLIGMDLGLTGEIEEITEGQEPATFFDAFPDRGLGKPQANSDLWALKASQEAYTCRLYVVEHDRPKSSGGGFWGRRGSSPAKSSTKALIQEISPYMQKDLEGTHLYVLDAYFGIYVYVGHKASSKSAEFVTASMLAQEMSILAPSLQDRPLMPICRIVFGEPPIDFRLTFRKWTHQRAVESNAAGNFDLPLNEVIEALE